MALRCVIAKCEKVDKVACVFSAPALMDSLGNFAKSTSTHATVLVSKNLKFENRRPKIDKNYFQTAQLKDFALQIPSQHASVTLVSSLVF